MDDFNKYLENLRFNILQIADITNEKSINYGYQFTVIKDAEKVVLTVYNGKKGRKIVWSGAGQLRNKLEAAVNGTAADTAAFNVRDDQKWAGSDESGKGDFFGPLVVAAVVLDKSSAEKLHMAGVKDCKALTDKKILELEKLIMADAVDYTVLELKPTYYNLRYEQIKQAGGNLNQLLTSGHIAALSKVIERQKDCSGALIDQFTLSNTIIELLKQKFPSVEFRQQPRAEADMAVAAASILARARFLQTMEHLTQKAGINLQKGGGSEATKCAKILAEKFGRDSLKDYVKLHFANYKSI